MAVGGPERGVGGIGGRVVFVTAAPRETAAVLAGLGRAGAEPTPPSRRALAWLSPRVGLLETGIGKANAASAVARIAGDVARASVINIGVAGTLDPARAPIGSAVAAAHSLFADEGVATPDGFIDAAGIGFPILPGLPGDRIPADPGLLAAVRGVVDHVGDIATVSTCSGTDALAKTIATRTGAVAEAMEGAAVGLVCHEAGLPFLEVRVVSNTTGDRARQVWRLDAALDRITAIVRTLAEGLR